MTCTGASNVFPIAIDGTFDDAQAIVKRIFGDTNFKAEWSLSAVNSINLARVLAQCVYYIYAWLKLPESVRESAVFAVPTGNFGNVLAGWMAWKCGMACGGFRVATNQNDILYRLFNTGVYEVSKVMPSYAPSMDIQVASNFERFIYFSENGDCGKVRSIMAEFSKSGKWVFDDFKSGNFSASKMTDSEIPAAIRRVWEKYSTVIDPHTACAFKDLPDSPTVVLSTAHPAKFPDLIEKSLGFSPKSEILEKLKKEEIKKYLMPADTQKIRDFICSNGIR